MNENLENRVKNLSWPQFYRLLEVIGIDSGEFNEKMTGNERLTRLAEQQRALSVAGREIEYAIDQFRYREKEKAKSDAEWRDRSIPERITGAKDTFLPVAFLELGTLAARSVCRVDINGDPEGTGFLVSESLVLTNNHVIPSVDAAHGAAFVFNYQAGVDGGSLPSRKFSFTGEPGEFWTDPKMDWTVVRLQENPGSEFHWLKLASYIPKGGSAANIIGHPQGRLKKISLYHNEIRDASESQISYSTDTEHGSSGSPVFDDQWQVIALHRGGNESGNVNKGIPAAMLRAQFIKLCLIP